MEVIETVEEYPPCGGQCRVSFCADTGVKRRICTPKSKPKLRRPMVIMGDAEKKSVIMNRMCEKATYN